MPSSIINSDDGLVSGTSGIKTTGGDDGVLNIQSNGTTAVTVNASGNVGIGTTTPSYSFNVYRSGDASIGIDGDTSAFARASIYNSSTNSSGLQMAKYRGTLASPTAVNSADGVGQLNYLAYGGTNLRSIARIDGVVDTYTSDTNISGNLRFLTNGGSTAPTERMRITSDGYLRMASGSGGIQFNGDTAAANALDDYEEGTWTPSLGGNTTYLAQSGKYIKIGRMVYVEGRVHVNVIGTGSTSEISGLPFTSDSQPTGVRGTLSVNSFYSVANNIIYPAMYLNGSATTAQFQAIAAAGTSVSTIGIFGNSTDIYFSGCYYAAT